MAAWMWIIGGPNGAGKSTFARQFIQDLGHADLVELNADERMISMRDRFPDASSHELNLQAAISIDLDVVSCIDAEISFVVETVLSSPKYRDDVEAAKARGMKFGLIYVSLHPPDLCPLRVSERVAKGGHDVDATKAIDRHGRSHAQLRWFAARADLLMIFDNSAPDAAPILLASRVGDVRSSRMHHIRGINPAVDRAFDEFTDAYDP